MTGDDILKLAGELFAKSRTPSEALCRAIIGRAYYSAFHLACDYLRGLGFATSGHGVPRLWLQASGEPNAIRAGELLADLYSARYRADYELNKARAVADSRNPEFVKDQIEWASDVKSLLEACNTEPHRSAIKAGIEAYRQRVSPRPSG